MLPRLPKGLSRRAKGELDFLWAAWTAAGGTARQQFLAELYAPVCRIERRPRTNKLAEFYGSALENYLQRHVVVSPGDRIRSATLYDHYRRVCLSRGDEPTTHTRFSRLLKARGYKSLLSNFVWWVGIKVVDDGGP